MKETFRENLGLSKTNIAKLETIKKIIEEYKKQGYKMTLRQLYYQLVSRDIIPNRVQEYQKLSTLLVKARMGGAVDWNSIEDRLRRPKVPYKVNDVPHAIKDTIRQYRLERQEGQDNYIEVWCEKDALSNVLYRVTAHYQIRLMVNRGYSSCTAMHDAFKRFQRAENRGQNVIILYLGDHDASGLDMIRDVTDRQDEFGVDPEIVHIALTKAQIEQYNPPPNPAKITDPRAKDYIAEHGATSWEVDALPPNVLEELLISSIEARIDSDMFDSIVAQEDRDKAKLSDFADDYDDSEEN